MSASLPYARVPTIVQTPVYDKDSMANNSGNKQNPARSNGDGKSALLLIDVISDFEFKDGDKLHKNAVPAAKAIAALKERAREAGVPVIYVNDNYGNWQEDFEGQVNEIIERRTRGGDIAELLRPDKEDYYVLKPQRSGFYETPLAVLLGSMDVSDVIVTGFTTDICVLFTAHDAYMRGMSVKVPSDCTAAVENEHRKTSLELLERVADVDVRSSTDVEFTSKGNKKGAHS
jgi:nicotinamidase-related amidase